MGTLLELIRQRRAELEAATALTDEQRIAALMSIAARAAQGDSEALAVVERLEAAAERPAMAGIYDLVTRMRAEAATSAGSSLRTIKNDS